MSNVMPRTRKRSEHYVNNKEFLAAIVAYKEEVALAETRGEPKPRITNYLGECFLKIATHIHYAFLRRIQKEKKQLEIKTKILERSGYDEVFSDDGMMAGSSSDYNSIKDAVQTRMYYQ